MRLDHWDERLLQSLDVHRVVVHDNVLIAHHSSIMRSALSISTPTRLYIPMACENLLPKSCTQKKSWSRLNVRDLELPERSCVEGRKTDKTKKSYRVSRGSGSLQKHRLQLVGSELASRRTHHPLMHLRAASETCWGVTWLFRTRSDY
jgi:hypothetical protein